MQRTDALSPDTAVASVDLRPIVLVGTTPGRLAIVRTGPNRRSRRAMVRLARMRNR